MTHADLMAGDRPWMVGVHLDPRPTALCVLVGVTVAATAFLLPVGLWCAMAAVCAFGLTRPRVGLHGGGRRPLSSMEWREWMAHFDLIAWERDHDG